MTTISIYLCTYYVPNHCADYPGLGRNSSYELPQHLVLTLTVAFINDQFQCRLVYLTSSQSVMLIANICTEFILCQVLGVSTKHVLTYLIFTAMLGDKYLLFYHYPYFYIQRNWSTETLNCPRNFSQTKNERKLS